MKKKERRKLKRLSRGTGSNAGSPQTVSKQASEPPGLIKPSEPLSRIYRITLFMVFVLLFLLAFRQVSSLDVGFHLKAGNYILEGNGWPRTDPFSYTCPDHIYIDSQWGYQVILAMAQKIGDSAGIVIFHVALVLAVFYLLYRTARLSPVDPMALILIFLLSAAASEFRFIARPELMSWLCLAAVLYVLHRYAEGFVSPLWLLPVIHLVWVNCHNGFMLGWGAIGCFYIGLGLKERRFDNNLLKWGAVSIAVSILNPYHIHGVLYPLQLLLPFQSEDPFGRSISELVSPFVVGRRSSSQFPFYPYFTLIPYFILFAASLAATVRLFRLKKFWSVLLLMPFLYFSAKMIRNIPLLVIVCMPALLQGITPGRFFGFFGMDASRYRKIAVILSSVLLLVLIGFAARVVNDAHYLSARRKDRFGLDWNREVLPIKTMKFVNRSGIIGPVLNHLNFGGYLMWATSHRTFIDGRLEVFGHDFFKEYKKCLTQQPDKKQWKQELEACVDRWGIQWAVFPYEINPELLNMMGHDPRWRLAYVDHKAVIFVRNVSGASRRVDPKLKSFLSPLAPLDLKALPGLFGNKRPGAFDRFVRGFFEKQMFSTHNHMIGLFHYFRRDLPKAQHYFAKAIQESRGYYYENYNNLGSVLFRMGQLDAAQQCYQIVLKDDPKNLIALSRLKRIKEMMWEKNIKKQKK